MDNAMKKILIVDDNEVHLVIAENILKGKYEVTTAKSGKDALVLLSKGYIPNAILLDVLMPEMDGWETYHKIRGISLLNQVPIVFLTSVHNADGVKRAQEIGAAAYITKPYNKSDLLNKIEAILENYRQ